MRTVLFALSLVAVAAAGLAPDARAQEAQKPGIYIIVDGSGSMWGQLPDASHKITVARDVLRTFIAGDFTGYDVAFRAYGHRREGDCRDSELVVPFGTPDNVVGQVQTFMEGLNPLGKTPITYSLEQALADFGDREGEIILISDGIENCDPDPCELVRRWQEQGVRIRVHVVGLGLEEVEKAAMQCISEAAGTEFRDADSADDLADGLRRIQEEAAEVIEEPRSVALRLIGRDANGRDMPVVGVLSGGEVDPYEVASHARNEVMPGAYELEAGVPTANGTVYRPVTQAVEVAPEGETVVEVEVSTPPSVHAVFEDTQGRQRGALVYAEPDGGEPFTFRWVDTVYVEPGPYTFKAAPNADNDLTVTAYLEPGQHREIVFELERTVEVTLKMLALRSELWFRKNYELWKNGEKQYDVHMINGARVRPDTYDVFLPGPLTPYLHRGLVVTNEDVQHYDITVPAGHVTVHYERADGTRDTVDRIWFIRLDDGTPSQQVVNRSGNRVPLTPGRYRVVGWSHKGTYEPVDFTLEIGQEKTVVLRDEG